MKKIYLCLIVFAALFLIKPVEISGNWTHHTEMTDADRDQWNEDVHDISGVYGNGEGDVWYWLPDGDTGDDRSGGGDRERAEPIDIVFLLDDGDGQIEVSSGNGFKPPCRDKQIARSSMLTGAHCTDEEVCKIEGQCTRQDRQDGNCNEVCYDVPDCTPVTCDNQCTVTELDGHPEFLGIYVEPEGVGEIHHNSTCFGWGSDAWDWGLAKTRFSYLGRISISLTIPVGYEIIASQGPCFDDDNPDQTDCGAHDSGENQYFLLAETDEPVDSCTLSFLPAGGDELYPGNTVSVGVIFNEIVGDGVASKVEFISSNPSALQSISGGNIYLDDTPPTFTGEFIVPEGATEGDRAGITAMGYLDNGTTCPAVLDTNFTILNVAQSWWQVKGADVWSRFGNVISELPITQFFNLSGLGGYPGIFVAGLGDVDPGQGQLTQTGVDWKVSTTYKGDTYDYSYFERKVPSDIKALWDEGSGVIDGGLVDDVADDLLIGEVKDSNDYYWIKHEGSLTIGSDLNFGTNKVILYVDEGDLIINESINNGFFMVIVDGDIDVKIDENSGTDPELEGVFVSDGSFNTDPEGNINEQLWVRGTVIAWGGVNLQRDLGDDNANTPAELFEYSPALYLAIPSNLNEKIMRWKEVAP